MRRGGKAVGALLALSGCLALWAPAADAAAPTNDAFANREDLGAGLPIEVERSNVGATEEAGEPDLNGSGHSIWFAWEATETAFVTIDTCNSGIGFRPEIGVFTGTELSALTEVAGDFASEGPDCMSSGWGTAVTFKAAAGVEYAIGVDGVASFFGPEQGQGFIDLKLEATPKPANDDFANATTLTGQTLPSGVYTAGASGYTWNATKEPGEPNHAGDPGGASVWYSWTAPSSDNYVLACGRFDKGLVGVYTGGAVNALTGVAANDRHCGMFILGATQGTTYAIAVDGEFDPGTGSPALSNFSLNLFRLPPSPLVGSAPRVPQEPKTRKQRPVDTTVRRRVIDSERRRATFSFRSNRKRSAFRCQLDRRRPTWCKAPKTYKHLSLGKHVFKVTAIAPGGSGDATPAIVRFRITGSR